MATPTSYQIKVALDDSKPPIWRRLLVSGDTRLSELHGIIQIAMGWTDSHLHQFISGGVFYGMPDDEFDTEDETRYRLSNLLSAEKQKIKYEYDFGDSWIHTITLEKILPVDDSIGLPRCTAGKRAAPPEDCGGVWGYRDLLDILSDPEHPQYEEMLDWLGVDEFDPNHLDLKKINDELSS